MSGRSVVKYGFAKINGKDIPYPSSTSGLQNVATFVNSARTADGVVRGEVIGRNVSKVELTWNALTPEEWSTILMEFKKSFYFNFTYLDMETNEFVTRKFYVGDRSAQPYLVDPATNRPAYYINCKANVIDVGE